MGGTGSKREGYLLETLKALEYFGGVGRTEFPRIPVNGFDPSKQGSSVEYCYRHFQSLPEEHQLRRQVDGHRVRHGYVRLRNSSLNTETTTLATLLAHKKDS